MIAASTVDWLRVKCRAFNRALTGTGSGFPPLRPASAMLAQEGTDRGRDFSFRGFYRVPPSTKVCLRAVRNPGNETRLNKP